MAKRRQKPTRADLEAENRLLRKQRTGGLIASVLNNLIRWGEAVAIAGFFYLSIDSLFGQDTTADIGIRLLGIVELNDVVFLLSGVGGVGYGLRQRKLRHDTIERLQGEKRTYETERDPTRTSSGLTPRGETHPTDK